ncbi:hypothetical protein ACLKMH_03075 [Psychromonas sp. KJ10-10]|uniref:hypothetical protein n=1 Tax=Psychromonas sp. KJ10-10 TaxID=3391823 RepID=UPI0039B64978
MEIIFVRHGKPLYSPLPFWLNAKEFECWLREYQISQIDVNSLPCDYLCKLMENSLIISSNLNRAKHSANIAIYKSKIKNTQPVQSFCLLDEVHIPYFIPVTIQDAKFSKL